MVTVTLILKFWILLYNNIYKHTFLVVAHQDCTNLTRGFSPLIYTGALEVWRLDRHSMILIYNFCVFSGLVDIYTYNETAIIIFLYNFVKVFKELKIIDL